jgi:hypothetical protein
MPCVALYGVSFRPYTTALLELKARHPEIPKTKCVKEQCGPLAWGKVLFIAKGLSGYRGSAEVRKFS